MNKIDMITRLENASTYEDEYGCPVLDDKTILEDAATEIKQLRSTIKALNAELSNCSEENAKLKKDKELYEKLRCFTPHEFTKLYDANICGRGSFDSLLSTWKFDR